MHPLSLPAFFGVPITVAGSPAGTMGRALAKGSVPLPGSQGCNKILWLPEGTPQS